MAALPTLPTMMPRSSNRAIKRTSFLSDFDDTDSGRDEKVKKPLKKCERSGCLCHRAVCFAGAAERCAGSGYTSRWYHISSGEHFCNECFDFYYRSHKDGYPRFSEWKLIWTANAKSDATIRGFMVDQILPFWLQCTKCKKWRQIFKDAEITPEIIQTYTCGSTFLGIKKVCSADSCNAPEDHRVEMTRDERWSQQLTNPPHMINSPATPYLANYFPDGIGISPCDPSLHTTVKPPVSQRFLEPFCTDNEPEKAFSFKPDFMTEGEVSEFASRYKFHTLYLALRNTLIALWNLSNKKWLTKELCAPHIICRGITRVWCIENIDGLLWFLTKKGYINTCCVSVPSKPSCVPLANVNEENVVVIGAGAAGLASAYQLHRFGVKVTVIEARSRFGGRVHDSEDLGLCVGKGAQMITGCVNNPMAIIGEEIGAKFTEISDKCELVNQQGEVINPNVDRRIDFHFNAMLDIIAEWRRNKEFSQDINLLDKLQEMHQQFLEESQLKFSQEEENLLYFHIANLEYACGAALSKVSSLHWDQNEAFPQFAGPHVLVRDGYSRLLQHLADEITIVYNTEICNIDYKNSSVIIKSTSGQEWMAGKVIVTVPLAVLRSDIIQFNPVLPQDKINAIFSLGIGHVEKVILRFKNKFWLKKIKKSNVFGHIPSDVTKRGLFSVFYDLSQFLDSAPVLMTHLSGDAVSIMWDKTDREIVAMCMEVLRSLFSDEEIEEPEHFLVTRWYTERYTQMAYSFIPTGIDGSVYDAMSQDVDGKLFFAGEGTIRQFPQSVSGAYLSGIREAEKIISSLRPV